MTDAFIVRACLAVDAEGLYDLSAHLNSVNLPHDRDATAEIASRSERSFRGELDASERQYVFVLEETGSSRIVGSSMIVAQLGTKGSPYVYFSVRPEETYSPTLDRYFHHRVLSIGYSYHGPTELGGLVVHPDYRRHPLKLGKWISFVRFMFICARRHEFQRELLSELMPPLTEDGTSHLWEAVGRHFTGLEYREADRLSRQNKQFIRSLFPTGDIYVSLLPEAAQRVVGQVGEGARGVETMLRGIGFRYAERVDPFDGGPHFIAETSQVSLIRACEVHSGLGHLREGGWCAAWSSDPPFFRCVQPAGPQWRENIDSLCSMDGSPSGIFLPFSA